MSSEHCDQICGIVERIYDIKEQLKNTEKELCEHIDDLCADVAKEVRRLQPLLIVTIQNGGCIIGYRTRNIVCKVKPYERCWDFASNEFGKQFERRFPSCVRLDNSVTDLACCVVEFFNSQYATLR